MTNTNTILAANILAAAIQAERGAGVFIRSGLRGRYLYRLGVVG